MTLVTPHSIFLISLISCFSYRAGHASALAKLSKSLIIGSVGVLIASKCLSLIVRWILIPRNTLWQLILIAVVGAYSSLTIHLQYPVQAFTTNIIMPGLEHDFLNGSSNDKSFTSYTDELENKTGCTKLLTQGSAQYSVPELQCANALRELYPTYSLISTLHNDLDPTEFPEATLDRLGEDKNVVETEYILSRKSNAPGTLRDSMSYAAHMITWEGYKFVVYIVKIPDPRCGHKTVRLFLHDGPEENIRDFLVAVGTWSNALRDDMWVFNRFWYKDAKLWQEVKKVDWSDVILKEDVKSALIKDINGFFDSEDLYKRLSIQWKRGMILYGPPGNGKTSCVKAIMKTCESKGFKPLYVCLFDDRKDITNVFKKARDLAPCVIIFEDLDSLVNKDNRSYFLNQLDGLDSNDGLLVIGTTNYVERLDPSLSSRPSRFDRKYLFENPDFEARKQYCRYWQNKLRASDIEFSDSMIDEVGNITDSFSFAYLKETFLSALARFITYEGETPPFVDILKGTIESLRKELATKSTKPESDD